MAKKKKSSLPVQDCCAPSMDRARERQYQIEDGARILQQAGKIASDPKLLKEIKAFAKKQVDQIEKIK